MSVSDCSVQIHPYSFHVSVTFDRSTDAQAVSNPVPTTHAQANPTHGETTTMTWQQSSTRHEVLWGLQRARSKAFTHFIRPLGPTFDWSHSHVARMEEKKDEDESQTHFVVERWFTFGIPAWQWCQGDSLLLSFIGLTLTGSRFGLVLGNKSVPRDDG
ncbi:unnamed protein product [Protopolystoma xenopodis]|uniref:Uncharacterized protein n=1 Tax=Protopolystoma xenopodis TaxID=117903 RepID=A0A3S5B4X9_9PLAT|nr:unnamed protein product [Protopolystoma xenopodis]